mgnify:CR=1 FL=1
MLCGWSDGAVADFDEGSTASIQNLQISHLRLPISTLVLPHVISLSIDELQSPSKPVSVAATFPGLEDLSLSVADFHRLVRTGIMKIIPQLKSLRIRGPSRLPASTVASILANGTHLSSLELGSIARWKFDFILHAHTLPPLSNLLIRPSWNHASKVCLNHGQTSEACVTKVLYDALKASWTTFLRRGGSRRSVSQTG